MTDPTPPSGKATADITLRERSPGVTRPAAGGWALQARRPPDRLRRVSTALMAAFTTDAIVRVIARESSDAVGSKTVTCGLLTTNDSMFEVVVHTGVSTDTAARWQRFANTGALPFPHVVRTRQPLFVQSAEEYGRLFPALARGFAEYGFQASAVLPLLAEGRVLGAMAFEFTEPRAFAEDDRESLIALAQQTALALDRAQRFDEERQARLAAEQANRAKSNFLAVVSHELRTPLNTISGYIDLMLTGVDGPLPDLYARYAERMRAAQKHVVSLIDSVLRFARVEAGQVSYAMASHNVLDLLRALEPLVEPQIRSRGIAFVLAPCELSLRLRADREKVIQILLNLISNAIKNTGAGGKIVIAAAQDGPAVTIRVSDTGRGIPAEALDRIFEPFVQIDPDSNGEAEGLGLGLAISRDLARGMNGDLEARSTVGQGSHFTLSLPAA